MQFADKTNLEENNDTFSEDKDLDEELEEYETVEKEKSAAEEITTEIDEDETTVTSFDSQADESESILNLESPGAEEEKNAVTADLELQTAEKASQSAATSDHQLSGQCGPDAYWEINDHCYNGHSWQFIK